MISGSLGNNTDFRFIGYTGEQGIDPATARLPPESTPAENPRQFIANQHL